MKKISLLIAISFLLNIAAWAQEAQFKSVFMYNFTKYVEWPASKKSGDFIIAVIGKDDVTPFLDAVAKSKLAGNQKIVVKQCNSAAEAAGSHMVFLSGSKSNDFESVAAVAKSSNALLVTDKSGLGRRGAGINFINEGGKIRFEVNKSAMEGSGLKVSNDLLKLGTVVG